MLNVAEKQISEVALRGDSAERFENLLMRREVVDLQVEEVAIVSCTWNLETGEPPLL